MTRQRNMIRPAIDQKAIDAGIRRAHQLRSEYLTSFLTGLMKKIVRWNQRHARSHRFHDLPDYLLKDIGIRRDQVGAIVSGSLKRDPLALSPAGSQSAPAFQVVSAVADEGTESGTEIRLAA